MTQTMQTVRRLRPAAPPRYLTPSGATVSIDAPGYDLGDPWFAFCRLVIQRPYAGVPDGPKTRHPSVAPVGALDHLLREVTHGTVDEELSAQGGRFRISLGNGKDRQGIVSWQGRWHEVYSFMHPSRNAAEALTHIGGATFHDSPLGLRITPNRAQGELLDSENIDKSVPGVGVLDIMPRSEAVRLLPQWPGHQVGSGEVWRKNPPAPGPLAPDYLLVFASETAVALVHPYPDTGDEPVQFVERLRELSWSKPN